METQCCISGDCQSILELIISGIDLKSCICMSEDIFKLVITDPKFVTRGLTADAIKKISRY